MGFSCGLRLLLGQKASFRPPRPRLQIHSNSRNVVSPKRPVPRPIQPTTRLTLPSAKPILALRQRKFLRRHTMLKRSLPVLLIALFALATLTFADDDVRQPKLAPQNSNTTQGLIAVSPVNERVVWASGRAGTFVVTTDGGRHWRSGVVPGSEALHFRDVEGVSDRVAYLQSIGDNPTDFRIYKTTDGGATWT